MKSGDLVRYKQHAKFGDYPDKWTEEGLLLEFDKVQRMCEILDNKTGKVIRMHCSDVQLVKTGHQKR